MTEIISISSAKGGVGKTTTVANLGTALATVFQKRVAVVDCNITNPHLGLALGTFSFWPVTLNAVLRNDADLEDAMHEHPSGMVVVPAAFDQKDVDTLQLNRLRAKLKAAFKDRADIVLLDSAPGLTRESMITLKCSDHTYFVATPHIPAVVDISKARQLLTTADAKPVGVILNRVRKKGYELRPEEVQQFTGLPLVGTIPEDEAVLKSTNFKQPVVDSHPSSRASRAFLHLAAHIAQEPLPADSRNLFATMRSWLFGI